MMGCRQNLSHSRGSVLLLVLWMLIILGVLGLAYSSSVRGQLSAMIMTRGRTEAYWAARAGIEKAAVLLAEADLTQLAGDDPLFDSEPLFRDQQVGGVAFFSISADALEPDAPPRYGLTDAASRININLIDEQMLLAMPGMTYPLAHALLDWRDSDDLPREAGAEFDDYMTLDDPYPPRNGPLRSVSELLRVQGWPELFRAARPDPYESFMSEPPPPSDFDQLEARLILASLTAWSADDGLAPDGRQRLDLASASESDLRQQLGLSEDEARAVTAHARDKGFKSPLDLIDVTEPPREEQQSRGNRGNQRGDRSRTQQNDSSNRSSDSNRKIFTLARVGEIIDSVQVGNGSALTQTQSQPQAGGAGDQSGRDRNESPQPQPTPTATPAGDATTSTPPMGGSTSEVKPGRINLNTASYDVLMLVPGMTETLALEIIRQRTGGRIERAGALASMGASEQVFRSAWPWLTAASRRFEVTAIGWEPASGARAVIEAVLAVDGAGTPRIIYWSEH